MRGGNQYKRGFWTVEEDEILSKHIEKNGTGSWNRIPILTGLQRCGKSCRLRWVNYLCPSVKHGIFNEQEDDLIIRLHNLLGNRWSLIAGRIPGRTDNQVKNHWNSQLSKKKLGVLKSVNRRRSKNSSSAKQDSSCQQRLVQDSTGETTLRINEVEEKMNNDKTLGGHDLEFIIVGGSDPQQLPQFGDRPLTTGFEPELFYGENDYLHCGVLEFSEFTNGECGSEDSFWRGLWYN